MSRTTLALAAAIAIAVASTDVPAAQAPQASAFDQVRSVVRDFGIANEFHYAEQEAFTDDLARLQERYSWPHADSVVLSVRLGADGAGWSVVGTHRRLGLEWGCSLWWGAGIPQPTPGGRPPGVHGRLTCDPGTVR